MVRDVDSIQVHVYTYNLNQCFVLIFLLKMIGRERSFAPSEAWSLIDERPSASACLQEANRAIDRSFSQTQWHVDLSETLSSGSGQGSTDEVIDPNLDPTASSLSNTRLFSNKQQPAPGVGGDSMGNENSTANLEQSSVQRSSRPELPPPRTQTNASPLPSSSLPISQPISIHIPETRKPNAQPPQTLNTGTLVPQQTGAQTARSPVSPSPTSSGKSKFMSALRNFKISKEPVKEQPKTLVNERHNSVDSGLPLACQSCYNFKMVGFRFW